MKMCKVIETTHILTKKKRDQTQLGELPGYPVVSLTEIGSPGCHQCGHHRQVQRYNVYLAELGLALWAVEFFFRRNDETRRFLVGFCGPKKVAVWKGNGYFNKNESRLLKYRNFARGF